MDYDLIYRKDARHAVLHNDGQAAVAAIEEIHAVDAVPVVRGEWEEAEMGYDDYAWVCTVCGEPWVLNAGTPSENNMNYCPNCGARMKGDK